MWLTARKGWKQLVTIVLVLFLLIIISGMRYKYFNSEYISHSATTQINGIFVFLVFMSHFRSYFDSAISYSRIYYEFQGFLGQLVVTTFLFYSGYGIFVSILKKERIMSISFLSRSLSC